MKSRKPCAKLTICFAILQTTALVVILLITSMQVLCFGSDTWFHHEYDKYSVLENLRGEEYIENPMSMDEALAITCDMMDYLEGEAEMLPSFFTEREAYHLEDCKALFMLAFKIRNILAIMLATTVAAMLYERRLNGRLPLKAIYRTYDLTNGGIVLLCLGIYVLSNFNFDVLFTKFHLMMFDNNLWLLDPRVDNLINLLPVGFFKDTIGMIIGITVGILVLIGVMIRLIDSIQTKRAK